MSFACRCCSWSWPRCLDSLRRTNRPPTLCARTNCSRWTTRGPTYSSFWPPPFRRYSSWASSAPNFAESRSTRHPDSMCARAPCRCHSDTAVCLSSGSGGAQWPSGQQASLPFRRRPPLPIQCPHLWRRGHRNLYEITARVTIPEFGWYDWILVFYRLVFLQYPIDYPLYYTSLLH